MSVESARADGRRVHPAPGDACERGAAGRQGGHAHADGAPLAQADAAARLRAPSARHLSVR